MLKKHFCLIAILLCSTLMAAAQTGLPKFKKGESYKSVRTKLLKAGWKPFHSPDADKCMDGDGRCQGRPEMFACAGTGMANCSFAWKKGSKFFTILTVGEDAAFSSSRSGKPL